MIRAGFLMVATLVAAPAAAQDFEAAETARNMGRLIGSEAYCGLTYDQAAIDAWVKKAMDPGDLKFTGHVEMGILGESYDQEDRSDSAKTAHCAAVRRSATHLGLIAE